MIPLIHGVDGMTVCQHLGAERCVHMEPMSDTVVSLRPCFPRFVAYLVAKLSGCRLFTSSMPKSPCSLEALGKCIGCVLQILRGGGLL